jgi:hypothetical protein
MGSIAEDSHAVILLADYVGLDAGNKLNLMGAGYSLAGWMAGQTAPMHVAVLIDVHGRHAGEQFTFTLELRDRDRNELVSLPGPTGTLEAMRISQVATAERPVLVGVPIPHDIPCRVQMQIGFPTGLPLTPGHRYSWRLLIDNTHRKNWVANFYVPELPSGPVFGGPADPGAIPAVAPTDDVEDPLDEG